MEKTKKNYVGEAALKTIIKVWAQFHSELRGVHKNRNIYAKMCEELANEHGVSLTPDELRNRINNLSKKYRYVNNCRRRGDDRTNWEYYEGIHKIFSGNKSNVKEEVEDLDDGNGSESLDGLTELAAFVDPLANNNERDEEPSSKYMVSEKEPTSSTSVKKRKKNCDEDFLELAKKEQKMMEHYLSKSLENEEKALSLMEQTNSILFAMLNKTN